jgi:protein-S-isoprenylcysteine O-methyltransferase Ste14
VFAAALGWPNVDTQELFLSQAVSWLGVLFCHVGLTLILWRLISFQESFRADIDTVRPDRLIMDGVFAFSHDPIHLAFAIILIGEF